VFRFAIGVDETAFTRATVAKPTVFATGVVDLHSGKLIDMIEGRRRKVLLDWPSGLPSGPGGSALSTELPHAVRVPNLFHVVRLGFARRRCAPPRATTYPWALRAAALRNPPGAPGCRVPDHHRLGAAAGPH